MNCYTLYQPRAIPSRKISSYTLNPHKLNPLWIRNDGVKTLKTDPKLKEKENGRITNNRCRYICWLYRNRNFTRVKYNLTSPSAPWDYSGFSWCYGIWFHKLQLVPLLWNVIVSILGSSFLSLIPKQCLAQ